MTTGRVIHSDTSFRGSPSAITALLGPTNTGKTHRAIERMLEHSTGMIGLPLRLLAREVYDRITARVGESRVALVTGEEQRIPARPSYWVATVEAMPVDREVEFLAVDEVQLAAHDQRGHVFTSRILSARGTKETWLLGASTMRPVLRELVPTARQVEHPRLSRLTYAGTVPLARVPKRSAVVAFSVPHVYEIAERLRARKGGAAVVLGALSPRTRNAQVAMFQAGEVDWLVATDAIGMGLNLDVDHVAFGALRKFDGRDVRDVDEAELAQIAGRAGRWVQDGTFGAITPLDLPAAPRSRSRRIASRRFGACAGGTTSSPSGRSKELRESLHVPSTRDDPREDRAGRRLVGARPARDARGRRAGRARRGGRAAPLGRLHGARLQEAAARGPRRFPGAALSSSSRGAVASRTTGSPRTYARSRPPTATSRCSSHASPPCARGRTSRTATPGSPRRANGRRRCARSRTA